MGYLIMVMQKSKPKYVPNNYIVQYSHQAEPSYMMLCKLVEDDKYRFVDLKKGLIYNLVFDSVEEAEDWLYTFGEVTDKNVIETVYIFLN